MRRFPLSSGEMCAFLEGGDAVILHGYCVREGCRRIVCTRLDARARAGRLKQRLNFLRRRFPEAEIAYQTLKTINDPALIDEWLAGMVRAQLVAKLRSGLTPQPSSLLTPSPVVEVA